MTRIRNQHIVKFLLLLALVVSSVIVSFTNLSRDGYRTLSDQERAVIQLPPNIQSSLSDIVQFAKKRIEEEEGRGHHDNESDGPQVHVTPLYWHVPKAGGTTVHDRYSYCYRLLEASEEGIIGHENEDTLKFVEAHGGKNYLNVDTTTLPGIIRSSELQLVPSEMAEIIFSPLLHESVTHLFSPDHQGQMFAFFRSPIPRVVSIFYYLQTATWEPTYNPEFQEMTIEQYANSPLAESNFLVRSLVNKMEGPLSMDDLDVAKKILRKKCLVGLLDRWDESLDRFDSFFGFQPHRDNAEVEGCVENLRENGGSNVHKHPKLDPDSEAYSILERKNFWDISLYKYIEELFEEQRLLFNGNVEGER